MFTTRLIIFGIKLTLNELNQNMNNFNVQFLHAVGPGAARGDDRDVGQFRDF